MTKRATRVPPTARSPKKAAEPNMAAVRQAMREHSHILASRQRTQPATGNQLWRLNVLGLLGSIMDQKREADEGATFDPNNGEAVDWLFISQDEASQILQYAREDGLW